MAVGLHERGRMGANVVVRLVRGGHRVVASNRGPGPVNEAKVIAALRNQFGGHAVKLESGELGGVEHEA